MEMMLTSKTLILKNTIDNYFFKESGWFRLQIQEYWHMECSFQYSSAFQPRETDGDSKMQVGTLLEYWETYDSRQGGLILDIKENGLCVRSLMDMYIGGELGIRVFFSIGHGFDGFQALARIIGKDLCSEEGWEVYEYQLEFIGISESDLLKLRNFLRIRRGKNTYS